MPELIPAEPGSPADRTVRALIIALLDMPLDAIIEVDADNSGPLLGVASVSRQPHHIGGYSQEFVTLKVRDA